MKSGADRPRAEAKPFGGVRWSMPLQRISYEFTIRLPASRERAFAWATDYRADDFGRMGLQARRRVRWLTPDMAVLTDTFRSDPFASTPGGRSVKVKLVHRYPQRFAWTATHLSGPARFSQFLYELTPLGGRQCQLRFRGNQVERTAKAPTAASLAVRARTLTAEDSQLWRHLARALRNER
jgi:hypothetical protein